MDRVEAQARYGGRRRDDETHNDFMTRMGLYWNAVGVRYFGPDDGKPRHEWCRGTACISCGCTRERPCHSHSEPMGYVDWVKRRGLNTSDVSGTSPDA